MKKKDIELVKDWTERLRAAGRTEQTIEQRAQWIRRLARETGEPLDTLDEQALTGWLAHPSWKRATRRSARASLRAFYGWAHETGRMDDNPAERLPAIREPAPCPRPVPEDVYGRALAEAGPREHLAILLAGSCGLRASEVARVHRDDLDRDLYGWTLVVHGKGEKERVVPVPDEVRHGLERAFKESPHGWAFPNMNDMTVPVSGAALSRRCRLYLEGHTFHALRHRYASKVYEASADLLSTQQLLGHASPVTTQRYVAVDRSRLRAASAAAA